MRQPGSHTRVAGELMVLSNRLPVRVGRRGWQLSAGGLVTAMRPVMAENRGRWVGWDGGYQDLPARLPGSDTELLPVALSPSELSGYYDGFANRTLWPLLHDALETPVFERDWWKSYQHVNEKFARAVAGADAGGRNTLWWVHDYHLLLLPKLLRDAGVPGKIRLFLHVPWPAPELFARLPWRQELLRGMLGADALSFHTERYRKNFARTCSRLLGQEGVNVTGTRIEVDDGQTVTTHANPISIDADEFADLARTPKVRAELEKLRDQFRGRRVLLGVDRLDYTKGIVERLEAFERLLDQRPDLRNELTLIQIAVPSRSGVREYRDLREQVERTVGRVNGRFTLPGSDVPVHYLRRGVSRTRLVAYYCLADLMLVTPLKDGMNLVAKEFVVSQDAIGGDAVLVLSEFTGAADELAEAITCNPFNPDGLAHIVADALELDAESARHRLRTMARQIRRNDIHHWAQ